MPILRSIFQAPSVDGDPRALQLLLAYWDPASPLQLDEALQRSSLLVAQLHPLQLRAQIAAHLGQHIDGPVQNLLLGERYALPDGRDFYAGWVGDASDANAADNQGVGGALMLIVGQTFNAAITRLRRSHGVIE